MRSSAQRRQLFMFLGVLLVAGGIGINILLPKLLGTNTPAPVAVATATAPVVVSSVPIVAGDAFGPNNLTLELFPVTIIPPGSFTSVAQLNGKFATIALGTGVPVTPEMLVNVKDDATHITTEPIVIPQGDIPYTLAYDAKTMGYFIRGDHVDIMASPQLTPTTYGPAIYAMTNIQILRMGNPTEQGATAAPTVVVLIVTRDQALQITNLLHGIYNGTPGWVIDAWVLRSPKDY